MALALLTITATLSALGCGKGGNGITDTGPDEPDPEDPAPTSEWTGPAPVGEVLYAVDLSNNFLVFGTESFDALTAKTRIQGVPILKRIIGIKIRPSNGKLYGVGNDSRVYVIDPLTAEATPVSSTPFSPSIVSAFDIHFAMDLEPSGDRVRLISAESGANWSISLDDGTAVEEEPARYAAGTPLEGRAPRLLGIAFAPPADPTDTSLCQNLAYGVDADEAIMVASCDPATGQWWPTVDEPAQASLSYRSTGPSLSVTGVPREFQELKDELLRCGEFMFEPGGPLGPTLPGEAPPSDNGQWRPATPPGPFTVFLVKAGNNVLGRLERLGVDVKVTITERGNIVSKEPIQSVEWVHPQYVPHPVPQASRRTQGNDVRLSAAEVPGAESGSPPAPPSDPRARCS
jgi:hypothetical protein